MNKGRTSQHLLRSGSRPRGWRGGGLCVAMFGALWGGEVGAQQPSARVTLEVDRHIARVGDRVRVEVEVQLDGTANYDQILPPTFQGFRVVGQGMSSQEYSLVNGRVSLKRGMVWVVSPTEVGTGKIGPAAVRVNGRIYRSPVVTIKVLSSQAPAPAARRSSPTPAPPAPALDPDTGGLPFVFVSGAVSSPRVYVGQQVVATWSIFSRRAVTAQPARPPSTDGFWSEDLVLRDQSWRRTEVRGVSYVTATLMQKALFPQKTGTLTIGRLKAQVNLGFFEQATRQSDPITLEVLPLPAAGRPPGFNPANVGHYVMAATLDRDRVKAGEAVTLKLVVQGDGNLRQLHMPRLAHLDGFKVYEPREEVSLQRVGQVSGEKVQDYLLLPRRGGRLTIPPVKLAIFDPRLGRYQVLRTAPLAVTVQGKVAGDRSEAERGGEARKNFLGLALRPPRPAVELENESPVRPLSSPLFWGLVAFPALALLLLGGGERLRATLRRETPRRAQRQAARQSAVHLKQARAQMQAGDRARFFGEVAAAFRDLLDQKLGIRTDGLTRSELTRRLERSGMDAALAREVVEALDNCDFARFSPAASGAEQMADTLRRAKRTLGRLLRARVRVEDGS